MASYPGTVGATPIAGAGPGLERISRILAHLGDPQLDFPTIHVGGTSGKGSTAAMAAAILTAAGLRTGLHLSPHLQILNERFQIDGRPAPTTTLLRLWELRVKPALDRAGRESVWGPATYFEALVALAFCLFADEKVDAAVVEVGLGGRIDATNVLAARVAVLTSIGLDHTEILGDTVEAIARDKAGIIKAGQTVVSGVTQASARAIVAERCRESGAVLWQQGRDFGLIDEGEDAFGVWLPGASYSGLHVPMPGDFQRENADCAVAAAYAFTGGLPETTVRQGLMTATLPGRMERVQSGPVVILDGAHNEDKMRAAAKAMERYGGRRRVVVLAVKSDKAYRDMLPLALAGAHRLVVTRFGGHGGRGPVEPEVLAAAARELFPDLPVSVERDPMDALGAAMAAAGPSGLVWVTGSLYLAGEVRERWQPAEDLIVEAEEGWG